eukprot:TRINITY_DN101890_c0_g1_i1.p1 TRINITY_DN101890_c0_g1~~TRINITY_DN101890_c0_g1_i1.p1  ORF type:complete len:520 (-),score=106.29 TRINITY_DN101890_c0_g1_i1:291-1640(-)
MARHGGQLSQALQMTLQKANASAPEDVPSELQAVLLKALGVVEGVRVWLADVRAYTHGLLHGYASEVPSGPFVRQQLLDELWSPSAWSTHCSGDVLVKPLWQTLAELRAQLWNAEAEVESSAFDVFRLSAYRAVAAGELAASQLRSGLPVQAHKETVAGLFNSTSRVESGLWHSPTLLKVGRGALLRAMQTATNGTRAPPDGALEHELLAKLKAQDSKLLQGSWKLESALAARQGLKEKLRVHAKSIMGQCFPPDKDAPRSRYARFATSSPAGNAVQLVLEAASFAQRAMEQQFQNAPLTLLEVLGEASYSGYLAANLTVDDIIAEPAMSRWWEWLPEPAPGAMFSSFETFMQSYQKASQSYEQRLRDSGGFVALHTFRQQLQALEDEVPIATAAFAAIKESQVDESWTAGSDGLAWMIQVLDAGAGMKEAAKAALLRAWWTLLVSLGL